MIQIKVNMRKHKGVTLVYVLVVVTMLIAFTGAILTLMVSNITLTANMKNNYKAQLAAETGIQRGIEVLKNKIINDSNNQNTYAKMEEDPTNTTYRYDLPATVQGTSGNPTISFSYNDVNGNRIIKDGRYAIDINSTVTVNGITKTIDAYVDERNIENKYFLKLFQTDAGSNQVVTTTDDSYKILSSSNVGSWPGVVASGNSIPAGSENSTSSFIVSTVPNDASAALVTATYSGGNGSNPVELTPAFDTFSRFIKSGTNGVTVPQIITVDELNGLLQSNYYNKQTVANNLNYAGIYKLILVHGDADISSLRHTLVNYIIYVDGTLTINANNPTQLNLVNCSVYARNFVNASNGATIINMMGMKNSSTDEKLLESLVSDGTSLSQQQINNIQANIGSLPATYNGAQFTANEKGVIDDELNKNLDNYYNGLEFRILDWKER